VNEAIARDWTAEPEKIIINTYTYIRKYMNAYYILIYIHTDTHTYIRTYIYNTHTCIHIYINTYTHIYIRSYIFTFIHAYIIHTYIQTCGVATS
jgi:hypothetical protein